MAINVKKRKGLYQLRSTISDEIIHQGEWVSEIEAKEALIMKAYWDFIYKTIEIDIDFPDAWSVNGNQPVSKKKSSYWMLENIDNSKAVIKKFNEIISKCEVDLDTTVPDSSE